jgi:hypothetical protein
MSVPNQFPTQQHRQSDSAAVVLAVLLGVGLMAVVGCAGIIGGLAFFYSRSSASLAQQQKAQRAVQKAQAAIAPDVMDWIVRSQLSRAYTQTLDAVTSNKDVIAALGDAIDTTNDPNLLFRRANTGQLQPDETIEFDIQGQHGAAVVSAICAQAQIHPSAMPGMAGGYSPKKITVTLKDGTQINVPSLTIETPPGDR